MASLRCTLRLACSLSLRVLGVGTTCSDKKIGRRMDPRAHFRRIYRLYTEDRYAYLMATSKTGSFWLTEEVTLDTVDTVVTGTIDLGAYVDVGDQQALAIESVEIS